MECVSTTNCCFTFIMDEMQLDAENVYEQTHMAFARSVSEENGSPFVLIEFTGVENWTFAQ